MILNVFDPQESQVCGDDNVFQHVFILTGKMLKSVELRINKHQIVYFCFPSSFDSAHENHQNRHGFDWRDYCLVYMSARYELFIHPRGRFFSPTQERAPCAAGEAESSRTL